LVALDTNAVVDFHIDSHSELQGELIGRGKRVARLTPSIAPCAAAMHRALLAVRRHAPNNSQQTALTGEVEEG
jgi:hypothetical protein